VLIKLHDSRELESSNPKKRSKRKILVDKLPQKDKSGDEHPKTKMFLRKLSQDKDLLSSLDPPASKEQQRQVISADLANLFSELEESDQRAVERGDSRKSSKQASIQYGYVEDAVALNSKASRSASLESGGNGDGSASQRYKSQLLYLQLPTQGELIRLNLDEKAIAKSLTPFVSSRPSISSVNIKVTKGKRMKDTVALDKAVQG
jgi:hypothetical protein